MKVNEMVQIRKGNNLGGVFIHEEIITGTIVKVNKKAIRVYMGQAKSLTNGEITREYDIDETETFTFWKTIDRHFGENAGKTVDIYKNSKYGIIEIAH